MQALEGILLDRLVVGMSDFEPLHLVGKGVTCPHPITSIIAMALSPSVEERAALLNRRLETFLCTNLAVLPFCPRLLAHISRVDASKLDHVESPVSGLTLAALLPGPLLPQISNPHPQTLSPS